MEIGYFVYEKNEVKATIIGILIIGTLMTVNANGGWSSDPMLGSKMVLAIVDAGTSNAINGHKCKPRSMISGL